MESGKFQNLIDHAIDKFSLVNIDVKGVLVCDRNGLPLENKDVSISPGPIGRLAELATLLTSRRTTLCLENNEAQVLIHQNDKAVVAIYTNNIT